MSPARKRKRDRLLLEQDGKCCYCKVRMLITPVEPGQRVPDAQCTFEHPYPKGHPQRGAGGYRQMLACFHCNNKRGVEHGKQLMKTDYPRMIGIERWLTRLTQPTRWLTPT